MSAVEERILGDNMSVFYLKDLKALYQERLQYLGADKKTTQSVNVTRLKEQIIREIPALKVQRDGRCVILTLEEDIGRALVECSQNTWHDEGIILSKAAKIVRKFLLVNEEKFDGDLSSEKQKGSVPLPLVNLISLIIDGETTIDNASANAAAVATNLAQLIRFNSIKTKRRSDGFLRHSVTNEPPLAVKIGLMIHSKTRKRSLVEKLAAEGISISYKRTIEIESLIAETAYRKPESRL